MKKLVVILFMLITITSSCKKDEEIIPNVSFSGSVNIFELYENPQIVKSDDYGSRLGIKGIVIYRVSNDEYYAFDLMCTNEKSINCLVEITDGATCTCPCCDSRFIIATSSGEKIDGPAKWGLKKYSTYLNGDYLYISN